MTPAQINIALGMDDGVHVDKQGREILTFNDLRAAQAWISDNKKK
jgi:hypothetical protein